MRVLLIYCHPVESSYNAALRDEVIRGLTTAGHDVDTCDLYAEGFDPALSREERLRYNDPNTNTQGIEAHVERLRRAEGLVFCFPTWWFGLPAMLKGYIDRVFVEGVAYDLSDPAHFKPALTHIRHMAAVTTYGQPRYAAWVMGDASRKMVTRILRQLTGRARVRYLALYHMNVATPKRLEGFKNRVRRAMEQFGVSA